mgnify:CR=1 FL=1
MKFGFVFFFSSRRRHTRLVRDWSSDVCSSDLYRKTYLVQRKTRNRLGYGLRGGWKGEEGGSLLVQNMLHTLMICISFVSGGLGFRVSGSKITKNCKKYDFVKTDAKYVTYAYTLHIIFKGG